LRVVACGGFMAAVRFTTRAFIAGTIEHDVTIEMTEFANVIVIFVARAVGRIEALFFFVP